jgi:dolichol-phosphate mannosyltransferase
MNLSSEIWIIIPTYNEAKNIAQLMNRILDAIPSAYLVIVDDSSPDGTAKIVCEVARSDERVHLLCRPAKLGYASAVVAGLQFALSEGASVLGYMDADLSHDPQALPLLVSAIQGDADLVIGSRYIAGGKVIGWAWKRKILSRCANWLVRILLGLPIRDSTSGFRLFQRKALEKLQLERLKVNGYAFQFVSTALAVWEGLKVVEVPITFRERQLGRSKMSQNIVFEAANVLIKLTWWRQTGQWLGTPVLVDA